MNEKSKGKALLKIVLPFLALLLALLFAIILWHYYHPNRTIHIHQTHVSQLQQRGALSHRLLPLLG